MVSSSLTRIAGFGCALGVGLLLTGLPTASASTPQSVSIDEQVSADGGTTWVEVGASNLSGAPTVLTGSGIELRVVVTDTGSDPVTDASVSVNGQPGVSAFAFGGATSTDISPDAPMTSDAVQLTASSSTTVTATLSAFSSSDTGATPDLSASDVASYATETPSIAIDEQISADDGRNWLEIGNENLVGAPTFGKGTNIAERVIITNTSNVDLGGLSVVVANQPGLTDFAFGGATRVGLAAGAQLTSDVAYPVAGSSLTNAATATALAKDTYGNTQEVSASDQVAYQVGGAALSIASAPNVTVDATSPAGATVSYTSPAVTDGADASTVASCTPAPGTVFAIGTTTVTCTASDPDTTPTKVSTTFGVTVKGAAAQLADLATEVAGVGPGKSLARKVEQAGKDVAKGRKAAACATLGGFIDEVHAQSGKHVAKAEAAELVAAAQQIQDVLGCPATHDCHGNGWLAPWWTLLHWVSGHGSPGQPTWASFSWFRSWLGRW